jgi:alkylhydroperoxidase/carboxymuconolactone decarboxylase family protein YurZ
MEDIVTDKELDRGRKMFRTIFGPDYGEELSQQLHEGELNRIAMCRIAPEIWELDGIDLKTKILCVIGISAAQKLEVSYFIRAAIFHGIPRRSIEHVMLLAGLEAGFPAALLAGRQIDEAIKAHELMTEKNNKLKN